MQDILFRSVYWTRSYINFTFSQEPLSMDRDRVIVALYEIFIGWAHLGEFLTKMIV